MISPGTAERVRRFVGYLYLVTAGVNAGLVLADPLVYRSFADGSMLGLVTEQWQEIVMARPTVWILLLAAGELVLGMLLLRGGRAARLGWIGVLSFQVLLLAFGYGFGLWSVPVLTVLVPVAHQDWPALAGVAEASAAGVGTGR